MPKSAFAARRKAKTHGFWLPKLRIQRGAGFHARNQTRPASVQALLAPTNPAVFQSIAN
jgi:hypothetical protein